MSNTPVAPRRAGPEAYLIQIFAKLARLDGKIDQAVTLRAEVQDIGKRVASLERENLVLTTRLATAKWALSILWGLAVVAFGAWAKNYLGAP